MRYYHQHGFNCICSIKQLGQSFYGTAFKESIRKGTQAYDTGTAAAALQFKEYRRKYVPVHGLTRVPRL